MNYINAKKILPASLLKELQGYIQGGYLYIPIKPDHQKHWGECSGYRQELQQRNICIQREYKNGTSVEVLAENYCLSIHAIRKVIYQK